MTMKVSPGDKITNLGRDGDKTVAKVEPGEQGGVWLTFEGYRGEKHFHLNPGEEQQIGLVHCATD